MRKSLFTAAVLLCSYFGFSQGANPNVVSAGPGGAGLPMFAYDLAGKPLAIKNVEEIEGTPYLLEEWNWGAVKLKNGRYAKDVSLKLDLYNNKLFFQREGTSFEFLAAVQEFIIGYKESFDSVALLYRSGYAPIDKNNEETFYEVLADGKTQLLNYRYKLITEYKPYNQPLRRKFTDKEQLYIATPDKRMVKISKSKDDIIKALPAQEAAINKIVDEKNLKLKKEEDIAKLIAALNQL